MNEANETDIQLMVWKTSSREMFCTKQLPLVEGETSWPVRAHSQDHLGVFEPASQPSGNSEKHSKSWVTQCFAFSSHFTHCPKPPGTAFQKHPQLSYVRKIRENSKLTGAALQPGSRCCMTHKFPQSLPRPQGRRERTIQHQVQGLEESELFGAENDLGSTAPSSWIDKDMISKQTQPYRIHPASLTATVIVFKGQWAVKRNSWPWRTWWC